MKIRNRKITADFPKRNGSFLETADAGGMKIEPYIRELIMGNEVKSKTEEWAEVVRQVAGMVGNNINQIAKNTNMGMEGDGGYFERGFGNAETNLGKGKNL